MYSRSLRVPVALCLRESLNHPSEPLGRILFTDYQSPFTAKGTNIYNKKSSIPAYRERSFLKED